MVWHRFRLKQSWQEPPAHKTTADEAPGEYDFHAFCLELIDVLWAWAFAGCVLLVLLVLL